MKLSLALSLAFAVSTFSPASAALRGNRPTATAKESPIEVELKELASKVADLEEDNVEIVDEMNILKETLGELPAEAASNKPAASTNGSNNKPPAPWQQVGAEDCPPRNNPVCVGGVTTYQNTCLALAQGELEDDLVVGPCRGDKKIEFDPSGNGLGKAEMARFDDERFKLVGKMKVHHEAPGKVELPDQAPDAIIDTAPPGEEKKVTRITKEGLVYIAKDHKPKQPDDTEDYSGKVDPPPLEDGSDGRKLALSFFGADTRSKVSSYAWPNWRLAELDWGSGKGGCSASIVGYNKVLTAAHCIYDAPNKQWNVPDYVAPGRYRSSTGSTIEPWGKWPVQYATVYTAWMNSGEYGYDDVKYDVAILNMGTNWAGNIGSYMGTLQVVAAPCSIDSYSRITGYPADKPAGEMWTTGECDEWSHSCGSDTVYHKCDIWYGHSGSAIYDSHNRVFGVQSGGGSQINTGFSFNSANKDQVLSWGG